MNVPIFVMLSVIAIALTYALVNFLFELDRYLGQVRPGRRISRAKGKITGYYTAPFQRHYPPVSHPIIEFQLPKRKRSQPITFRAKQTKTEVDMWQRSEYDLIVCYDPANPKDARLFIPQEYFPLNTGKFIWGWIRRVGPGIGLYLIFMLVVIFALVFFKIDVRRR